MSLKFPLIFVLLSTLSFGSFSQGQLLPPSFRIPDNKMPGSFYTKEMVDTFKLNTSKPVVTPYTPTSNPNVGNPYSGSRNEYQSPPNLDMVESEVSNVPQNVMEFMKKSKIPVADTKMYFCKMNPLYSYKSTYKIVYLANGKDVTLILDNEANQITSP